MKTRRCAAQTVRAIIAFLQRWDIRRLQALHGAALVAREMGMEAGFEDSVFFATHHSYVDTLSDLKRKFLIERAADIAFQI